MRLLGRELARENDMSDSTVALELRRFYPDGTLQTRIVEKQVTLVLRLRAFHRDGGGHGDTGCLAAVRLTRLSHAAVNIVKCRRKSVVRSRRRR